MSLIYVPNSGISWTNLSSINLFQVRFTNDLAEPVAIKSLTVPLAYGSGAITVNDTLTTFAGECMARCFVEDSSYNYDTTATVSASVASSDNTRSYFNNLDSTCLTTFNFDSGTKIDPGASIIFNIRYASGASKSCLCACWSSATDTAQSRCSTQYQTSTLKLNSLGNIKDYTIYTYPGKTINLNNYMVPNSSYYNDPAYKLLGWSYTSGGALLCETESNTSQNFSIESNITLYEVWQECYYITFYENSTATEAIRSIYLFEDTLTIPSDITCSLSGCTFKGWSTDPSDIETTVYSNGDLVSVSTLAISPGDKLDFYPVFINTLKFYTTIDTLWRTCEKRYDVPIVLPEEPPSTGFSGFENWRSSTGEEYYPLSTYTLNQDTDFYAILLCEINFNTLNGTLDSDPPTYYVYNQPISLPTATKNHYIFKGWSDTKNSSTLVCAVDEEFSPMQGTIDLYAVYEPMQYTLSFDANGGSNPPEAISYSYSEDFIFIPDTEDNPTREHYEFKGWSDASDSSEVKYSHTGNNTYYCGQSSTVLYAVWEELPKYTVEFNTGSSTESQEVYQGDSIILPSISLEGNILLGWSTTNNKADVLPEGSSYTVTEDVIFYAMWEVITYTLSFNANGGTGIPESVTYAHGTEEYINLSETIPTYTGYTFLGWSTNSTSTVSEYQPGDSFYLSNNSTVLYAVWKLNDITSGNSASSDYIKNPGNYSVGTDWAVTFNRKAATPLDRSSLFSSYADALAYAQGNGSDSRGLGTTAYVGQIVSVYEPSTNSVSVYVIAPNGVLAHISAGDIDLDINYATDEDVVEILTNLNVVTPVADEDGALFTV